MSARAYVLSDGNSFYCSCERVFDARLAWLLVERHDKFGLVLDFPPAMSAL